MSRSPIVRRAVLALLGLVGSVVPLAAADLPTPQPGLRGFVGRYFDNENFTGTSVVHAGEVLAMDVGHGSPDPAIDPDTFSARWIGWIFPQYSQSYTFTARTDDGCRVWVNGQMLVDSWIPQSPTDYSGSITLTAGQPALVQVEYLELGRDATCQLSWATTSLAKQLIPMELIIRPDSDTTPPTPMPSPHSTYASERTVRLAWNAASDDQAIGWYEVLRDGAVIGSTCGLTFHDTDRSGGTTYQYAVRPVDWLGNAGPITAAIAVTTATAPAPGAGTGLLGTYHADTELSRPMLTRTDAKIDATWGAGSPDPAVPADQFSVQWRGDLLPRYSETYTFQATFDDNVRVWVDGHLLIDNWIGGAGTYAADIALLAGVRVPIRIDYLERTGSAEAHLWWESLSESREIVPSSQLFPAAATDPAQIDVLTPVASATSPAWVEGRVGLAGNVVTATHAGQPVGIVRLGGRGWYVDAAGAGNPLGMALQADAPIALTVASQAADGATRTQMVSLTWTATDMIGQTAGAAIASLRVGDALLLKAGAAATEFDLAYDGASFSADVSAAGGAAVAAAFPTAGEWVIAARAGGAIVGSARVRVLAVAFDGPIADQLAFQRSTTATVTPAALASVVTFAADDAERFLVGTSGGTALTLRPLYRGTPTLLARLGGANGPLVASQVVDEFQVTAASTSGMRLVEQFSDGSLLLEATYRMAPKVPGLSITLATIVSGATLDDSTRTRTFSSDSLTSEGEDGVYVYRLILDPSVGAYSCHSFEISQRGVRINP